MTSPLVSGVLFPVFASLYCIVATLKHHCLKNGQLDRKGGGKADRAVEAA